MEHACKHTVFSITSMYRMQGLTVSLPLYAAAVPIDFHPQASMHGTPLSTPTAIRRQCSHVLCHAGAPYSMHFELSCVSAAQPLTHMYVYV